MIVSFLDLDVYKDSFQLNIEMEEIVATFPPSEKFLLIDQMTRASRAIPAVIAEGYSKRDSIKEFQKYMRVCIGEVNEMVNHLMLAKKKSYMTVEKADLLIERYIVLAKRLTKLKDTWRNFK